jgi:hypothetical protein
MFRRQLLLQSLILLRHGARQIFLVRDELPGNARIGNVPRICAAKIAAFTAPAFPIAMVATGIPPASAP